VRAAEQVAALEPDAVARPRRFGDQHVARRQPLEVAAEHVALRELRLRRFHVVGQQMGRQHLVAVVLEPLADRASGQDAAAIAADRTGEIDGHWSLVLGQRFSNSRTRSIGIASAVPFAERTVVAWNSALYTASSVASSAASNSGEAASGGSVTRARPAASLKRLRTSRGPENAIPKTA